MILSILKIIGIILLIILVIILLLLGIVLLVPIRYRFSGTFQEKLNGTAKITWIPFLLKGVAEVKDNQLQYTVRLLGGVVMSNKGEKISWLGRKMFEEEEPGQRPEKKNKKNKTNKNKKKDSIVIDDGQSINVDDLQMNNIADEYELQEETAKSEKHQSKKNKTSNAKKSKGGLKKKKISLGEKIAQLKQKLHNIIEQLKQLNKKREALMKVYQSARFRQAKKDVIKYMKAAFRLLKPDQLEGHVIFGTGDPASTGEMFGILAMALPLYYSFLVVEPDFENKIIDADLKGKGKLRLISIVILMIKVLLNKNLIKVVKRVQTIMNR